MIPHKGKLRLKGICTPENVIFQTSASFSDAFPSLGTQGDHGGVSSSVFALNLCVSFQRQTPSNHWDDAVAH